jgi:regulator of sirC expression with transglutaminase-like and TPR domain
MIIASLLSPARRKTMAMTAFARSYRLAAVVLAALAAAPAARADQFDAQRQQKYEDCMAQAQRVPADGYETALAWEGQGGGDPARHCAAVALIGLGKYQEAADKLESLAAGLADKKQPQLAAEAFAQAGQAWKMAGDTKRALDDAAAGLKLAPEDVDLLVDRAVAYATLGDFRSAIADLDKANTLAPKRADVLAYRASAWRLLDDLGKARADADAAVTLDPKNVEALLERGNIRRLTDDAAGARADWLQVVELAAGTPAGDAAKANLEKLDVKP